MKTNNKYLQEIYYNRENNLNGNYECYTNIAIKEKNDNELVFHTKR